MSKTFLQISLLDRLFSILLIIEKLLRLNHSRCKQSVQLKEGRSYNFQIKLCEKRSAMSGCPVVNERNISKSENLEIFCSQNFDCCSGKSFGENSHFPSTALLENLVFPFRFRTNLRSKLSISYSASKKLPTRRSISSVGSGAERTAMCAGHSAPSTHPHTILGD